MSGNDIVDMASAAAESNWKRKGFLEKVFTAQEQQYIREAASPDEMVWKLWSMKESAYKVYTRQYGGRFFAPKKFNSTLLNASAGMVEISDVTYHTVTFSCKKYIYSIARPAGPGNDHFTGCFFRAPRLDHRSQQQFIYEKMVSHYATITGKQIKKIAVIKDRNGIPYLHCSGEKPDIPVSITHHGRFAAYIIY
jgi:phosphopantetheinyl transferase (holo-ACP synthase)